MLRKIKSLLQLLNSKHLSGEINQPSNSEIIDLENDESIKSPYQIYADLRQKGSIHFLEKHGFWVVVDYDEVSKGLKDNKRFTNLLGRELDSVLVGADAENHQRVRTILNPFFSNKEIAKLEKFTRERSLELLKRIANFDSFEIVQNYSIPLTESVIAHLLGLNEDELGYLSFELRTKKYQLGYYDLLTEFFTIHFEDKIWKDDLLSNLIKAQTLSNEEIISLAKLFWVAGTTTTSMLISTAIFQLLQFPLLRQKVQNDFYLIPNFIEECLRYESPEQMAWRVANEDVEIGETKIEKGAQIMFCLGAANRDEQHFPNPNEFQLNRTQKDHLAFLGGAHYCIGAGLARMEAQVALESLFTTLPDFKENQNLTEVKFAKSFHFRAIEQLNVRR